MEKTIATGKFWLHILFKQHARHVKMKAVELHFDKSIGSQRFTYEFACIKNQLFRYDLWQLPRWIINYLMLWNNNRIFYLALHMTDIIVLKTNTIN